MVKLLLCGQVNGQWDAIFERAKKLNAGAKAAPFEALLVVGGVFPFPAAYLSQEKSVPVPTYFVSSGEKEASWSEDEQQKAVYDQMAKADGVCTEIVPNLFFLGSSGIAKIAGLKVAFVSGTEAQDKAASPMSFSTETVSTLRESLVEEGDEDVDFLLTAEYANNFQNLLPEQQTPQVLQLVRGSSTLRDLVQVLHPKYHITSSMSAEAGGVFYQRLPYVSEHKTSGRKRITRLIGLCGVNSSKDKQKKYLHALQVVPSSEELAAQIDIPAGTTQNPYIYVPSSEQPELKRRRLDDSTASARGLSADQIAQLTTQSGQGAQFFYDQKIAARGQRHGALARSGQDNRRREPVPERTECWFCLATPSVERHLIVSIGQEAYLAMPKGAISLDHVLIVPIAHEASSMKLSASCWREIDQFKSQLHKYFASQDKDMIVFDRNISTMGATHCHLQVVGVPRERAALARGIFESEGERYNVRFEELSADADLAERTQDKPFLYVEVPNAETPEGPATRLLHFVEGKHYVQFGRHAAACALDMPRRANWKFCVVPKPEEEAMTKQFKALWQPFDFTQDEEDDDA